jgi:predicted DNA-binding ribbon-helix-helix protein
MKSLILKRAITINGRRTSISLEEAFWECLKDIAAHQHLSVPELVSKIASNRKRGNLSSAVRLFVLDHYQQRHHDKGRHGTFRSM